MVANQCCGSSSDLGSNEEPQKEDLKNEVPRDRGVECGDLNHIVSKDGRLEGDNEAEVEGEVEGTEGFADFRASSQASLWSFSVPSSELQSATESFSLRDRPSLAIGSDELSPPESSLENLSPEKLSPVNLSADSDGGQAPRSEASRIAGRPRIEHDSDETQNGNRNRECAKKEGIAMSKRKRKVLKPLSTRRRLRVTDLRVSEERGDWVEKCVDSGLTETSVSRTEQGRVGGVLMAVNDPLAKDSRSGNSLRELSSDSEVRDVIDFKPSQNTGRVLGHVGEVGHARDTRDASLLDETQELKIVSRKTHPSPRRPSRRTESQEPVQLSRSVGKLAPVDIEARAPFGPNRSRSRMASSFGAARNFSNFSRPNFPSPSAARLRPFLSLPRISCPEFLTPRSLWVKGWILVGSCFLSGIAFILTLTFTLIFLRLVQTVLFPYKMIKAPMSIDYQPFQLLGKEPNGLFIFGLRNCPHHFLSHSLSYTLSHSQPNNRDEGREVGFSEDANIFKALQEPKVALGYTMLDAGGQLINYCKPLEVVVDFEFDENVFKQLRTRAEDGRNELPIGLGPGAERGYPNGSHTHSYTAPHKHAHTDTHSDSRTDSGWMRVLTLQREERSRVFEIRAAVFDGRGLKAGEGAETIFPEHQMTDAELGIVSLRSLVLQNVPFFSRLFSFFGFFGQKKSDWQFRRTHITINPTWDPAICPVKSWGRWGRSFPFPSFAFWRSTKVGDTSFESGKVNLKEGRAKEVAAQRPLGTLLKLRVSPAIPVRHVSVTVGRRFSSSFLNFAQRHPRFILLALALPPACMMAASAFVVALCLGLYHIK